MEIVADSKQLSRLGVAPDHAPTPCAMTNVGRVQSRRSRGVLFGAVPLVYTSTRSVLDRLTDYLGDRGQETDAAV